MNGQKPRGLSPLSLLSSPESGGGGYGEVALRELIDSCTPESAGMSLDRWEFWTCESKQGHECTPWLWDGDNMDLREKSDETASHKCSDSHLGTVAQVD